MIEQRSFPRAPQSVPIARQFVARAVADAPKEIADRVEVMVSEIATNAVRHAGTDFVIQVEYTPNQICIEITDTGSGEPSLRSPSPSDRSGRGLRIVEMLSDEWGVRRAPERHGKTVWFSVDLGAHAEVDSDAVER